MSQSFTVLTYHVVFATKHRLPMIDARFDVRLFEYMKATAESKGCLIHQVNGVEDHVHLLIEISASRAVASVVSSIKANSSRFAKQLMDAPEFCWQSGYAAFTVSASQLPKVRHYIEQQKQHHARVSYRSEIEQLFEPHGLPSAGDFLQAASSDSAEEA